jgi:tetratricopeptide (TPR) repeat protein
MIKLTILITPSAAEGTEFNALVTAPEATSWKCSHSVDWSEVEHEVASLSRSLKRVVQRRRDLAAIQGQGQFIFDVLFPDDLKQLLRSQEGFLRLACHGTEMPWHLLHDGHRFLGERWSIGTIQNKNVLNDLATVCEGESKALVVADPACDLPAARFEGEAVLAALNQVSAEIQGDVRFGPVRKNEFLKSFKGHQILHYAGHFDGGDDVPLGWRFHDGHVGPKDFKLMRGGGSPELFFSNACKAAKAADFSMLVDVGVQNYIAPMVDVPDLASADFSRRFYDALCKGKAVGDALKDATWEGVEHRDYVGLSYRLFGPPDRQYFRADTRNEAVSRIRRPCFLYLRLANSSSHEMNHALRTFAKTVINKHGGHVLPGANAIVRTAFGLSAAREDDRLRALNSAFEIRKQMMGTVAIVCDGQVETDGRDAQADYLIEMEAALWGLQPGVYGGGSVPQWGALWVNAQQCDGTEYVRLTKVPSNQITAPTVFVGRKGELERLRALSEQCLLKQRARIVLINGVAGIGKTKLVEAFTDVHRHAFSYVMIGAPSYRGSSAWHIFSGIVRGLLGLSNVDSGQVDWALLKDRIRDIAAGSDKLTSTVELLTIDDLLSEPAVSAELTQFEHVYAAFLEIEPPAEPLTEDLMIQAVGALIKKQSLLKPICLVVEGVARLDPVTRLSVQRLIDRVSSASIFVIKTSREEQTLLSDWQGEVMALGPLPKTDAQMLVTQTTLNLGARVVNELVQRAQGNPLFLTQLARSSDDGNIESIPASIEILFSSRLDALSTDEQQCLQLGAIIGRQFSAQEVSGIMTQPRDISDLMTRLCKLDCLQRLADGRYRFTHQLFGEVVYQSVSSHQTQVWHGRYALLLSELDDPVTGESLLAIAHHFRLSGDEERGEMFTLRAANKAAVMGDYVRAERALENVSVESVKRIGTPEVDAARYYEILGAANALSGCLQTSVEQFVKSVALSEKGTEFWSRRVRAYTEALSNSGQEIESLAVAREAIELLMRQPEHQRPGLLGLLIIRGWSEYKQKMTDAGMRTLQEALEMSDPTNDKQIGMIENFLGVNALFTSDYRKAESHLTEGLRRHQCSGDLKLIARSSNNLGILFHRLGQGERAISHFELVIRCHQERGDRLSLALVYNNLGSLYGDMGNYLKAERFFRETIRIRAPAQHAGLALALTNLAGALYHLGRLSDSRVALDEAVELLPDGEAPSYMESGLLRYQGLLEMTEGDLEAAAQSLKQSVSAAQRLGGAVPLFEAKSALARLEVRRNGLAVGLACFEAALAGIDVLLHQNLIGRTFHEWAECVRVLAPLEADSYHVWAVALTTGVRD